MRFEQKEYQTVILAALLHDIGKFLHRLTGIEELTGAHQELGADFVVGKGVFGENGVHSNLNSFSRTIRDDWVYKDRLEKAIRRHHRGYEPWGWIVHKADSYSTKERFTEDEGVTTYPPRGPLVPLRPVFSSVNLGKSKREGIFGYAANVLDSFLSFPEPNKKQLGEHEAYSLFKEFINELQSVGAREVTFEKFYDTLHSVLEKYLWCLPCHTHPEIADVSIFDHLRSSSAIAACLYHYHCSKDTLRVRDIKRDEEKKFLLVGGALSGIQRYIYQISSVTGEGGVAKRLRARSFHVSALLEVIIVRILRELELPVSCKFLSAGGKFVILAPNDEKRKGQLETLYRNISDWLLEQFSGELFLLMDWSTELNGDDFFRRSSQHPQEGGSEEALEALEATEEEEADQQRRCNFRDRIDDLRLALENKKLSKFEVCLHNGKCWHEERFVRKDKYASYRTGGGDCHSCRKFPAEYGDPHALEGVEKVLCKQCTVDKVIGRKLLDANYLVIGHDLSGARLATQKNMQLGEWDCFFFFDDHYFIQLLEDYEWAPDFLLVQRLRDRGNEGRPVHPGMVYRFLANYTPFFEDYSEDQKLCKLCKEPGSCEQIEMMRRRKEGKHLYTFSCIAAASSTRTDDSGHYQGAQLIGVLKADIDNLGLIFSEGLEDRLTISRYLTMSRMLDLFFSGWMYRILNETSEYREIYTVYSGGDDLVLVGPWERVISFAQKLNEEFRRFTCDNQNITLSAGIAIVQPKYPISAAVELADSYLEASKTSGKDCVTFFDTTVKWPELYKLVQCADLLHKAHEEYSGILTTGFIHRLLAYQQMYSDARRGNIRKLIFHSLMHYDVRRNLTERISRLEDDQKKNYFLENVLPLMLKLYQTPLDHDLMSGLRIPVHWTLYKSRTYRKGGV